MKGYLVLVVLFAFWMFSKIKAKKSDISMPFPRQSLCIPHNKKIPLVIPLVRDSNNIFLLDLNVNGHWIKCAVDTGSTELVVSGKDCDACDLKHGSVPTPMIGKKSVQAYGSQVDKVVWGKKQIKFFAWEYGDHTPDLPVCIGGNVDVAVTTKRTGTSNYNILGIGVDKDGLMSDLMGLPRAYAIIVDSVDKARLIMYKPIETVDSHRYKTVKDRFLSIKSVNGFPAENILLLLDTGSNAMILPTHIYDIVVDSVNIKMPNDIVFRFKINKKNRWNAQIQKTERPIIVIGVTHLVGYTVAIEHSIQNQHIIITPPSL